jgi:Flp pilus assembly CpaE family ATPase
MIATITKDNLPEIRELLQRIHHEVRRGRRRRRREAHGAVRLHVRCWWISLRRLGAMGRSVTFLSLKPRSGERRLIDMNSLAAGI